MKKFLGLVLGLLWCNASFAEDVVYYCVDDATSGFETQDESFEQINYKPGRFKLLINIENKTFEVDDAVFTKSGSGFYTDGLRQSMRFIDVKKNTNKFQYIRSSIFYGDSIYVAHGWCEKF
jgi:hypothetical protein